MSRLPLRWRDAEASENLRNATNQKKDAAGFMSPGWFRMVGMVVNLIVGVYIPIIFPIKGGMTIPNRRIVKRILGGKCWCFFCVFFVGRAFYFGKIPKNISHRKKKGIVETKILPRKLTRPLQRDPFFSPTCHLPAIHFQGQNLLLVSGRRPPNTHNVCWKTIKTSPQQNWDLGGGFKHFFSFIPTWGGFPFWLIFFRWVETTN